MIRSILAGAALAMLGAVAQAEAPATSSPAGHQTGEESAVLAAMDRYLAAISTNDLALMASLQTPDGMTYRARAMEGGGMEVVGRPNSYWVDPARNDGRKHRERYWMPTVMVRGGTQSSGRPMNSGSMARPVTAASTCSISSRRAERGILPTRCGPWSRTPAASCGRRMPRAFVPRIDRAPAMDQIPTSDLLSLLLTQRGSIDLQFQFWLSITFAVIVAGFVAGRRLDFKLRLLAAAFTCWRPSLSPPAGCTTAASASAGWPCLSAEVSTSASLGFSAYLRMAVMLLGTVSALVFLLRHDRREGGDG